MCCHLHVVAQPKKVITAHRSEDPVQIDGLLNEPCWNACDFVSDFVQTKPNPGAAATHQCCIKVFYDDTGIYIGAELDEGEMAKIGTELFERDNLDDSKKIDWFAVILDCYGKGLTGYGFVVSASGVQTDIKFTSQDDDASWDAVWDSEVHQYETYWTCEMKIPYSALRFPDQEEQRWGIQFGRRSYQRQEESFWNPILPDQDGFLSQAGILEGIKDIKPPPRFSATPFVAAYAENFYDPASDENSSWGSSYNAGMDIKYGISDAYTLDMTLIPDFGQTQSDNEVLNLSPFEVQFDENRQFFTEGTELFSKADLFYSRRVGGTPYYYDQLKEGLDVNESEASLPTDSRLINATKISGRDKHGTGLGYFNAISPRQHAQIKNSLTGIKREALVQPWTNYNVLVLDQNLSNNSYVSLINTNVTREGAARDANVTGMEFDLRDKTNKYGIAGSAAYSQQWDVDKKIDGYKYFLELARNSGNLTWSVSQSVLSDTYDPNDLGFLGNNNDNTWHGSIAYNEYEPFGPFLNGGLGFNARYSGLYRFPGAKEEQYRPNLYTSAGFESWFNGLFKNYYEVNFYIYTQPTNGYEYFEPRVPGRFFEYPALKNLGISLHTDARKKLLLSVWGRYNKFQEKDKYRLGAGFEFQYRINNHFSVNYNFDQLYMTLDRGYITEIGKDIVFGARDYKDITQLYEMRYTFNPKMSLSFRLRHNWTRVTYTHFYTLQEDGTLEDRVYTENENINFNAWTIDTNFRWRFAPGSDLYIVWKNSIFGQDQNSMISYGENLNALFDKPQSNSFSVKAIYYIDFQGSKQK